MGITLVQLEFLELATILLGIAQVYAKKTTELIQQLMWGKGQVGRGNYFIARFIKIKDVLGWISDAMLEFIFFVSKVCSDLFKRSSGDILEYRRDWGE